MADGVDGFDDLRFRAQSIEQPAGSDGVGHADRCPHHAPVGADAGDRLGEINRSNRSDLAAGLDPRRVEARVEEAGGQLAGALPTEQQQPRLALTGGRTA